MKEIRVGEGNEAVKSPPLTFFMLHLLYMVKVIANFKSKKKTHFSLLYFHFVVSLDRKPKPPALPATIPAVSADRSFRLTAA